MNLYVAKHKEKKKERIYPNNSAKCKREKTGTFMYTVIMTYTWNPLIRTFLELPVFYCTVTAKILFLGL